MVTSQIDVPVETCTVQAVPLHYRVELSVYSSEAKKMDAGVATSSQTATNLKRFRSTSSDDNEELSQKIFKRPRYHYILAPESSQDDCTDDSMETVYSIQNRETDLAKDTSDTSTDTLYEVEFDVVSLPDENIYPLPSRDSSSSPEDVIKQLELAHSVILSDTEPWERSSVSSENVKGCHRLWLYRTCVQCGKQNPIPIYRYCSKCYRIRKNFFPPRPKKEKPKRKNTKKPVQQSSSKDTGISLSSGESHPTLPLDLVGETSSQRLSEPEDSLCHTCLARPKNGGYVHSNIVHIYSCYQCSKRTIKTTGRCPICNVRVKQVCKVITL